MDDSGLCYYVHCYSRDLRLSNVIASLCLLTLQNTRGDRAKEEEEEEEITGKEKG